MSQTKAQLISDLVQALNFTGTASAPANGLFLSATNTLQLSTASTPRLTINSDGHVDVVGNLDVGAGIDVTGTTNLSGALNLFNGDVTINSALPIINLTDTDNNSDFSIRNSDGTFLVHDNTNTANRISVNSSGVVNIPGNTDFGAGIDVTGDITATGDLTITSTVPRIFLTDSNSDSDFAIANSNGIFKINDQTNSLTRLSIASDGTTTILQNLDVGAGIDVTGAITGTTALIGATTYGGGGAAPALYVSNTGGRQVKIHNPNAGTSSLQITNATTGQGEDAGTQLFTQATTGDFHTINKFVSGDIAFTTTVSGPTSGERMRIDSDGTIFSFSPNDTTPNIKWRSDDTNWFGSLNQSVEGATISTFLSTGGDWSANGTTYSATKSIASFETRAIVLHPQFNNGAGKVAFLQKAAGSTTTDGTVTEILKIDNDGIKFGGDTAAANALDDYEEGTWTPTFNNAGGFGNDTSVGKYTKIGRVVHWVCQVAFVRDSSSSSGTFTISGLPFTALNQATGGHGYAGCMGALFNWNIPDTAYQIGIRVPDNNTFIQFFANFDNAADSQISSPFDANKTIFGSLAGTYIT